MSNSFLQSGRQRVLALALIPALVAALAFGAGSAWTAFGDNPVTFYGCIAGSTRALYNVVTSPATPLACLKGDAAVSWSQVGPAGPQGPQGPQGPAGPAGASATKVVAGNVYWDGTLEYDSGAFTATRVDEGVYRVDFPAGTWTGKTVPVPVLTTLGRNSCFLGGTGFGGEGSSTFTVRCISATGAAQDAYFYFFVAQG